RRLARFLAVLSASRRPPLLLFRIMVYQATNRDSRSANLLAAVLRRNRATATGCLHRPVMGTLSAKRPVRLWLVAACFLFCPRRCLCVGSGKVRAKNPLDSV